MKPKISTIRMLLEHLSNAYEWFDYVPIDLRSSVEDNPYINGHREALWELIRIHFHENYDYLCLAINISLNESPKLTFDLQCGEKISINTLDEYCDYLVKYEGWEE